MKFNEYVALSEHLKKEGSSINEFVQEVTGKPLYEKDKEPGLNTKSIASDVVAGVANPKFAIGRRKITNNAKHFKKIAEKQLIDKYVKSSLNKLQEVTNGIVSVAKDVKNPKEIINVAGDQLKAAQLEQKQQMDSIIKAIDKLEGNYSGRVSEIVDKFGTSEKNKMKLDVYWTVVSTQVKQLLLKAIIDKRSEFVNNITKKNKAIGVVLQQMEKQSNLNTKFGEYQQKAKSETEKFKQIKTEKEGEKTSEEKTYNPGEKYKYTSSDGNELEITIESIDSDTGDIRAKSAKGTKFVAIKNNIGEKIETPSA